MAHDLLSLALVLSLILLITQPVCGNPCGYKHDEDCHKCPSPSVSKHALAESGHYHHKLTTDQLIALELKAGEYYYNQMDERNSQMNLDFTRASANYPCIAGMIPLGGSDAEGISDGHKYSCGPHVIHGAPILYSFGSHQDQRFELALLEIRPDAKIFIFEVLADQIVPAVSRDPRITYIHAGLGYNKLDLCINNPCLSMQEAMRQYNHSYIDIVKMDIEGGEFEWLQQESAVVGPRIGQLLIEVRKTAETERQFPGQNAYTFVKHLEDMAFLRLMHTEVNVHAPLWGVEYSLLNANWIGWNLVRKYEFLLPPAKTATSPARKK